MSDPRLWSGDDWYTQSVDLSDNELAEFSENIEEITDMANQGNWDATVGTSNTVDPTIPRA